MLASYGCSYHQRDQACEILRSLIAAIACVVPAPSAAVLRKSSSVSSSVKRIVATLVPGTATSAESAKNSPKQQTRPHPAYKIPRPASSPGLPFGIATVMIEAIVRSVLAEGQRFGVVRLRRVDPLQRSAGGQRLKLGLDVHETWRRPVENRIAGARLVSPAARCGHL